MGSRFIGTHHRFCGIDQHTAFLFFSESRWHMWMLLWKNRKIVCHTPIDAEANEHTLFNSQIKFHRAVDGLI